MDLYWLWFSLLPGIPLKKKLSLLARFGSPEALYRTEEKPQSMEPALWKAIQNKSLDRAIQVSEECRRKGIGLLAIHDPRYPSPLKNIQDPPLLLYWLGNLPDLSSRPRVGVVGTRRASGYGLQIARTMGFQLTAHGATVISGMAKGIDGAAIQGALDAGGSPIGVLGTGVDVVYPKCNAGLFSCVMERGCLFSEYPPGTPGANWTFPQRNRIISGLSDSVLVVEAPRNSGAIITARRALEQGRQVFAAPGHVGEAGFVGSLELMRDGAELAVCGWDILKHLEARYPGKLMKEIPTVPELLEVPNLQEPPKAPGKTKKADHRPAPVAAEKPKPPEDLTPMEKALYRVLTPDPQDVDVLIGLSGLSAGEFMSALTMLQLRGIAERHPDAMVSFR